MSGRADPALPHGIHDRLEGFWRLRVSNAVAAPRDRVGKDLVDDGGPAIGIAIKEALVELVPMRRLVGSKDAGIRQRSEEHTSELQSLMRISYAVFCLKKKNKHQQPTSKQQHHIKQQQRYHKHHI